VFASDRGQRRSIWIVGADGGPPRKIVDADVIGGPTWSHDGQEIVYSAGIGGGPGLGKVAATGGTPARIPTPAFASDPVVSPAGDVIAYISITRTEGAASSDLAARHFRSCRIGPAPDSPTDWPPGHLTATA
jgi:Tol biopolymer transport system component